MSAIFKIKINAIRTGNVDSLTQVIRKVEFTVEGVENGQTFELPQTVDLSEPEASSFKPLSEVTELDVINWVEANFTNMEAVKQHIQLVLDREVAKAALESSPLPWAPVPEAPAAEPAAV